MDALLTNWCCRFPEDAANLGVTDSVQYVWTKGERLRDVAGMRGGCGRDRPAARTPGLAAGHSRTHDRLHAA